MRDAATRMHAAVVAVVHEHFARAMYYFSVQLMYASFVGCAAWILTSIPGASATSKYWIWVTSAFNFVIPAGAIVDSLLTLHLRWAAPLAVIGGPIWEITQGRIALALFLTWMIGTLANARATAAASSQGMSRDENREQVNKLQPDILG